MSVGDDHLDYAKLTQPEAARQVARSSIAPAVWLAWRYGASALSNELDALHSGVAGVPVFIAEEIAVVAVCGLLGLAAWYAVSRIASVLLVIAAMGEEVGTFLASGIGLSLVIGALVIFLGAAGTRGAFVWHHFRHKQRLAAKVR